MTYELPQFSRPDVSDELAAYTAAETTLAEVELANTTVLASEPYLSVIRGCLRTLVDTVYYYSEEDRACTMAAYQNVANVLPRFDVTPGQVYYDAPEIGMRRTPTGEISFFYLIALDAPGKWEDSPMDYDRTLGAKLRLDGTEFHLHLGEVIIAPDGSRRYQRVPWDDDSYYVVGPNGAEVRHPDPASLFPKFSEEQERELEQMALATTDALIQAYGPNHRVIWDKTKGVIWDIKSPGTRDQWRLAGLHGQIEPTDSGTSL